MKHATSRRAAFARWTGQESTLKAGVGVAVVTALVFVIWLIWVVVSLAGRVERADGAIAQQRTAIARADTDRKALATAVSEANAKLKSLGQTPVIVPPPPAGVVSSAQIDAAVARYCATGLCTPRNGRDAPAPTPAQVEAAVRAVCADDACKGADGAAPSDAQIGSAVAAYCASNTCRGEDGTDGTNGTNGTDGKDGTATPGTYTCPDGQVVAGFTVSVGGAVTLDCRDIPGQPNPNPTNGG